MSNLLKAKRFDVDVYFRKLYEYNCNGGGFSIDYDLAYKVSKVFFSGDKLLFNSFVNEFVDVVCVEGYRFDVFSVRGFLMDRYMEKLSGIAYGMYQDRKTNLFRVMVWSYGNRCVYDENTKAYFNDFYSLEDISRILSGDLNGGSDRDFVSMCALLFYHMFKQIFDVYDKTYHPLMSSNPCID